MNGQYIYLALGRSFEHITVEKTTTCYQVLLVCFERGWIKE